MVLKVFFSERCPRAMNSIILYLALGKLNNGHCWVQSTGEGKVQKMKEMERGRKLGGIKDVQVLREGEGSAT